MAVINSKLNTQRGIDQKLRDTINKSLLLAFDGFRNNIIDVLSQAHAPNTLLDALRNIEISNQTSSFISFLNDYIQNNYIDKLLNTVAFLSKEDLADMAESLVRMTCLKRHITTDEESVGGASRRRCNNKRRRFYLDKAKTLF